MAPALLEFGYTLVTVSLLYWFINKSLLRVRRVKTLWFFFGFVFNLFSLSWLYAAYPLSWMPAGILQFLAIVLVHLLLSLIGGISFSFVGYAFTLTQKSLFRLFLFPALLACAEIVRSFLFSIFFLQSGGSVGLYWGGGTVGNALSSTPFVEYAYFGGVYALTFILGILVFSVADRKDFKLWWLVPAAVCVVYIFIHDFVPIHMPQKPIRVAAITTNFESDITKENLASEFALRFEKLQSTTLSLTDKKVDLIAYPEDARYLSHLKEKDLDSLGASFPHTIFVDGDTRESQKGFYNYSLFYTPQQKKSVAGRGKVFLFPFNEYIPILFEPLFHFLVRGKTLSEYVQTRAYVPATSMEVYKNEGLSIGTLICSEILSYSAIAELGKKHPDIVIFQSYLSTFHGNPWLLMNILSFSKVAAAQLRTPIIESANAAPSYIISPYGSIISSTPQGFGISLVHLDPQKMVIEK